MGEVEIPEDTAASRIAARLAPKTGAARDAGNPDDVATLDQKLAAFWEAFPDGRIWTDVECRKGGEYVVVACIWTDIGDTHPRVTATSSVTRGEGEWPYSEWPLETAESIAIGRCIRFLGMKGNET